jgi:hypothetical protein
MRGCKGATKGQNCSGMTHVEAKIGVAALKCFFKISIPRF